MKHVELIAACSNLSLMKIPQDLMTVLLEAKIITILCENKIKQLTGTHTDTKLIKTARRIVAV